MKKLLFVINDLSFFISHRLPIAIAAKKIGYEIHIASVDKEADRELIISKGFFFYPIKLKRSSFNPINEFETIVSIYDLYKKLRPDIVHLVTIKPVLYGGIAARFAKIPAVVSAISGLGFVFIADGFFAKIRRFFVEQVYRLALKHDNLKVIFQNFDDRSYFIENDLIKKDQAVLIQGSGVDTDVFTLKTEPDSLPVVIMACRMLWDKGVGEFVKAAEFLQSKGVKAQFVLVGDADDGNPASVSVETLEEWHKKGIIEWRGFEKDMSAIFERSHVVCLPSYREGLPKVLIEAASCGRSIVTSDVPGCREIVIHEMNGLLVPPRDFRSLAEAIERLILDRDLRLKMGKNGRKYVESDFRIDIVVAKTLEIYREFLKD